MLIYFIGPGGAGKTTLAKQFSKDFGAIYYDLDEHFMLNLGNISQFINTYGYK
ncbi:shikimate kinase, partial [Acinetobacter lactucae]|uniref:shikimate kinase n=2 Tax=Acinetobacter TaxID=469 RepID=UPI0034A0B499